MDSPRRTFVVRVYTEAVTTVEDVRSGSRVTVGALEEVGHRISAWLKSPAPPAQAEPDGEAGGD